METRAFLWTGGVAAALVGVFAASGAYTFAFANGIDYLSNEPAACVNCHVMRAQFDGWSRSSHHAVAVCNDCHLPQQSLPGKLLVKASNGWHHSKAFTTGEFAEPIRIRPSNARVLEENCLRCHAGMIEAITRGSPSASNTELYGCVRCHPGVGHTR